MQPIALLEQLTRPDPPEDGLPPGLILAAHADDEVIGLGGRLPRLRRATFAHVTDGAPKDMQDARANGCETREEYARLRRRELEAALALAGIGPEQTREMGCMDQETSLRLAELSRAAADLFRETGAAFVLTHPYEGGHPDHDATAFVAHAACRLLGAGAPALLEMTSYFNRHGNITPFEFLPGTGSEPVTVTLTEAERAFKERLMACYPSQQGTLQYFPVGVERFRPAPRYDFTSPPHAGTLFYECFDWGMTGERFRALAREAMDALGLEGPL
jgi:LmbE family N-acetylglucosaminyl deacetylase